MAQPIWNTISGNIGTFPSSISMTYQLSASAVAPATTITYLLLSGSLPTGLTMNSSGRISGTPDLVPSNTTSMFVVRATDNLGNIRDRTFNLVITGAIGPQFTLPAGTIAQVNDSTWVELPVTYNNPISTNDVTIRIVQGSLPPGLEINSYGIIRGYASPPIINVNLGSVVTASTVISASEVSCFSTTGFAVGRPVVFTGTVFGGVVENQQYYIQSILGDSSFTISLTPGGTAYTLNDAVGYMTVTLPDISVGQPTIQTYSFILKLESPLGSDTQSYEITVANQNTPASEGGPGLPLNTRVPTILNTRPATYNIAADSLTFDYYKFPTDSHGETYAPSTPAYIGQIESDNFFTFRILGLDFDQNDIEYVFANLPLGLTGNSVTGWIEGTPIIADDSISQFSFSVAVRKTANHALTTANVNFTFKISNAVQGEIEWITPSDMGIIFNGTLSTEKIEATSDIDLTYRIASGELPPNLTLFSNGEISGIVAYQPTNTLLSAGDTSTFTFTVEAYSERFPVVQSQKTFTITVSQEYTQPTDTLYIKCTPSIADRLLLRGLLEDDDVIPPEAIYRPDDPYFGKATSVVYEHAYGIFASNFEEYIAAVTKNHYWRQLTLGELKTAVARNSAGEIIYEVVYSEVIDNLVNPEGTSVSKEIVWPRPIPLELGPWYTSSTSLYTSYVTSGDLSPQQQLVTQLFIPIVTQGYDAFITQTGLPQFFTSMTPGFAQTLYPNSLINMREQVGDVLGQEFNAALLPKWMTSQQENGSTTGFVPAWVICYTKPGFANAVKESIETNWVDPLGRPYSLNTINFKIDRFTVDKSTTFNYDNALVPPAWTGLPSATPTPDPTDSKDFYVLFPRQTILPGETEF